ncbi:hypothetical protein [Corynebacterium sp. A21]|uniref:hypothetical protein n=1 Tax=Corynebacterium sp. A21 TaxID=3457318 RepID=UPI003FD64A23
MWLLLGLLAMLSAVSLVLSYAAYTQIYKGENEGFPLNPESSAIPAGTYQAGSKVLAESPRTSAGGDRFATLLVRHKAPSTDTGQDAALKCEASSFQAATGHGLPWSGATDPADALAFNHLNNFYVMTSATDHKLGGLDSGIPSASELAGQIDCLDGGTSLEAISTANKTLATSIDGGSTWL